MMGHLNSVQFDIYLVCALNSVEFQAGAVLSFALENDTV